MIGKKVRLKKSHAKWHLDHPEVYQKPNGAMDICYEPETLIHLMCCMGVPITGWVTSEGGSRGVWGVTWLVGNLSAFYYVDKNHYEKI